MVTSCSSTKKALGLVNKIDITIKADKDVNPDAHGNPSPVRVRFYELSDAANFRKADFASLLNNDQAAIGDQNLGREEFELKPEALHTIARGVKPDTRYLGIVAAYHNVDKIKWRAIISINTDDTTVAVVNLGKTGMTAANNLIEK